MHPLYVYLCMPIYVCMYICIIGIDLIVFWKSRSHIMYPLKTEETGILIQSESESLINLGQRGGDGRAVVYILVVVNRTSTSKERQYRRVEADRYLSSSRED